MLQLCLQTGVTFVSHSLCFFSQAWILEKALAPSSATKHTWSVCTDVLCCGPAVFLSGHWWESPLQSLLIYLETNNPCSFSKYRRDNYGSPGDAAKLSVRNGELQQTVETPQQLWYRSPWKHMESVQESLPRVVLCSGSVCDFTLIGKFNRTTLVGVRAGLSLQLEPLFPFTGRAWLGALWTGSILFWEVGQTTESGAITVIAAVSVADSCVLVNGKQQKLQK